MLIYSGAETGVEPFLWGLPVRAFFFIHSVASTVCFRLYAALKVARKGWSKGEGKPVGLNTTGEPRLEIFSGTRNALARPSG